MRQFVNTDTQSFIDTCLVYVLLTKYTNSSIVGTEWGQIPIVSLLSPSDRFSQITCRCKMMQTINIPLDISKFDNNIAPWMMSTIVDALIKHFPSITYKLQNISNLIHHNCFLHYGTWTH